MGRILFRDHARCCRPFGKGCQLVFIFVAIVSTFSPTAFAQRKEKPTPWLVNFDRAMADARKQNRLVLVYFSGSDWDPWCQKLDEEVLETNLFRAWAAEHVILLRIDFPREKRLSGTLTQQNDQLKVRYSVSKTPTFVFLDPWGQAISRAGYDDARRRKEESPGNPKAWIEFLDKVIASRPPEIPIATQPSFTAAMATAKAKYGMAIMLITHGSTPHALELRDNLLRDQQFVKFINANITFVSFPWPEDTDQSPPAVVFRAFATQEKIVPVPFQLVIYDVAMKVGKARYFTYDPNHVEALISKIQSQLPHIDYSGGWLTDYSMARTIAAQQDRCLLIAFTSMDTGEWSSRMDREIFQAPDFATYAKKNLVLLKVDFPNSASQPAASTDRLLADLFNIRGFPTVVVINPLGQKLVDAKYMKGGPKPFLDELDPIIHSDAIRRTALKD